MFLSSLLNLAISATPPAVPPTAITRATVSSTFQETPPLLRACSGAGAGLSVTTGPGGGVS